MVWVLSPWHRRLKAHVAPTMWSIYKVGGLCVHERWATAELRMVEGTTSHGLCLLLHGLIVVRGLCRVLLHSAHRHGRGRHACMEVVQLTTYR